MKKIFSVLMVAFAMTAMVACSEKDNNDNKSDKNNPTPQRNDYLPAGIFSYSYDDIQTDDHTLSILLDDEHDFTYTIIHSNIDEDINDYESYAFSGEYEFSGDSGKGILKLHNISDGSFAGNAEFTYDHNNSITVTFLDETVTMTKTY